MKFPFIILKRSTYEKLQSDLANAKKNDYRDKKGRFVKAPAKKKK